MKNDASLQKLRNRKAKMEMDEPSKKMQTGKLMQRSEKSIKYEMSEKLNDVKHMIDKHTHEIHSTVTDSAKRTIAFVEALQEKNSNLGAAKKRNKSGKKSIKMNSALSSLLKVWQELKPKNTSPDVSVSFEFSESVEKDDDGKKSAKKENELQVSLHRVIYPPGILKWQTDFQLTGIESKIDRFRRNDYLVPVPQPIKKVRIQTIILLENGREHETHYLIELVTNLTQPRNHKYQLTIFKSGMGPHTIPNAPIRKQSFGNNCKYVYIACI